MLRQLCDTSLGQRLRSPEVCGPCTVHTVPGHLFIYHLCRGFPNLSPVRFSHALLKFGPAGTELSSLLFLHLLYLHCAAVSSCKLRVQESSPTALFSLGPTSHHILPIVTLRYILLFTRLHFGHHCWVSDHHRVQPALQQASSS